MTVKTLQELKDAGITYVVFFTHGNKEFGEILNKRANELGYEGASYQPQTSVTLDICGGKIYYTNSINKADIDHVEGDLKAFLSTDFYKFEKPACYLGGYQLEFLDNQQAKSVYGNLTFTRAEVEEVLEAFRRMD